MGFGCSIEPPQDGVLTSLGLVIRKRFSMTVLFFVVLVCLFGHAYSVGGLGEACLAAGTCTTTADHVCDPATKKCTVIADNAKTGCSGDNTNCPTNAACSSDKCDCASGYTQEGGLCTVVGSSPITCSSNTDCTSKMANTECAITSPCTKGYCQCKTGYSGVVCQLLGNDMACDTAVDLCGTGFTCNSGTTKCACDADTYKTEISACSAKKMFGVACDNDTQCYANLDGSGNGKCSTTCGCADGYIKDTATQLCRSPYRTETCHHGVACGKVNIRGLLTSESSQEEPTCSATSTDSPGTCGCATSGQTMESAKMGSTCYNYCLTPCGNGSGMKKTERGMIVLSFILLLAFIF